MPKTVTITIRSREDVLPGLDKQPDTVVEEFVRNDFTKTFNELGWDVINVVSTSATFPGLFPRGAPGAFPRLFPREGQTEGMRTEGMQRIRIPTPEEVAQGRRVDIFLAKEKKGEGFSYKIGEEPPPANAKAFVVDTEEKASGIHFPTSVAAVDESEAMRIVERNPRFKAISAKRLLGGV